MEVIREENESIIGRSRLFSQDTEPLNSVSVSSH